MTEKLIEALINTGKFVVLERQALADVLAEQNLGNVAHVEPAVVGRLTSAQALIRGVITNVDSDEAEESRGIPLGKKIRVGIKNQKVSVKVNLRIIDTVTGQVLQSKTVEGVGRLRGLRIRKGGADVKVKRDRAIGEALDDAVDLAVADIVDGMESIPWQGSLSRVSGRQVIVNAGYQENVEPGLELRVFERGAELIDRDTNETLGRLDEEIGIIRVVRVEPRFSVAEVVQGRGFAAGNIVRPTGGP